MRNFWMFYLLVIIYGCSNGTSNTPTAKSPPPGKSAPKEAKIDGRTVYNKHCMECHQENGEGVPNIYPTLKNAEWVGAEKEHLIEIIINGMTKQIVVNGIAYEDEMPKADYLTNKEIAAVLTHIRINFANIPDPISEVDVARTRIRLKSKK
jgi:mono/diheme cytochrome c family protein